MTTLPFTVNGVDFSSLVTKRQYKTNRIPVIGTKYTDLAKIDHTTIARYKGYLEVSLNPLSPSQAEDLYEQLLNAPCEVTYYNFQLQQTVTELMIPAFEGLQDAKQRESGHWLSNSTVNFTEE